MAQTAKSAKLERGRWVTKHFPKKASTAFENGTLCQLNAGYVEPATTTAGSSDVPLAGIYNGPTITSSSSNYASTDYVPVLVPEGPLAEARIKVGTGSLAATDVGKSFDVDTDSNVTVSTTTNEPVTCTRYISATEGIFVLTNASSPAA